jgi:MerR family transcriptional regulator, light-induced transcriptional regulator
VGTYSIKELEKLSGIKAHTIRIWEKRHNLIHPSRTSTNIRFYSDDDLKKIINVSLLNNHGVKISRIAGMSSDEINRNVLDVTSSQASASAYIEQLVVAMVDLNEAQFDSIIAALVKQFGFERTVTEAIYPFLEKIGILWQTYNINPAQEHFISNLIRQKIIAAIDALPLANNSKKKILLFLPEREMHEMGLLFNYYLAKKAGFKAFYLGQNVPHGDLVSVVATHQPQTLVTSITNTQPKGVSAYLSLLATEFTDKKILVTGIQLATMTENHPANVHPFRNSVAFNDLISRL